MTILGWWEREHETGMHSKRVACHTQVLARAVTDDAVFLQQIYWGSLLHDIGKIAIPDAILLKQESLDEAEWAIMRTHPEKGYAIVKSISFLGDAAEIVLNHEEHYDGNGYPHGYRGDEIPFGARLFAVIDALDAMTSDRPYRSAMRFDEARREIVNMSGSQFDPGVVDVFLDSETTLRQMVEMKCTDAPGQYT